MLEADQAYQNSPTMSARPAPSCQRGCRPLTPTTHGRMAGADNIISLGVTVVMSGPDEASQGNSSGPNPKPTEEFQCLRLIQLYQTASWLSSACKTYKSCTKGGALICNDNSCANVTLRRN